MRRQQNVLFIVVDQWRGDHLAFLGHPAVQTPNIDRLAQRGVTFTRHYGQVAPCAPARASLLTGLYAMTHRVVANGIPLDARHATLPLVLREAGIDPCLIGYTTTTPDPRTTSAQDPRFREIGDVADGWRVVAHFDEDVWRNYFAWAEGQGVALPPVPMDLMGPDGPPGPTGLPARIPAHGSDTAWTAAHAIEFLRTDRSGRPWLLHCGFQRPHPPFAAPAPWHAVTDPALIPPAIGAASLDDEAAQHPMMAYWLGSQKRSSFFHGASGVVQPLTATEVTLTRQAYCGLIAEVDDAIGRVLAALDASGQAQDTLVVFTSDHGEQLGDHGLLGKLGWFDQSYHLPLVIADPSRPSAHGRLVDAFTESVDLMPTMLDWLGVAMPSACDGTSLIPFLEGAPPAGWRDAVCWEFDVRGGFPSPNSPPFGLSVADGAMCAMRTDAWKYVSFAGLPPLLYDLRADPNESRNVAEHPDYAPLRLAAAERMLRWRMQHADKGLTGFGATPAGLVGRG